MVMAVVVQLRFQAMVSARAEALRCAVLGDLDVAATESFEDDLSITDRIQLAAANEPAVDPDSP